MNALYSNFKHKGFEVYYVMLENDSEQAATLDYCKSWKALYSVATPVVSDPFGYMWGFIGKVPGVGVIINRDTMEIESITDGGDWAVYKYLLDLYQ